MSSDSVEKHWYRVLFNDKGVPVSALQCEEPSEGFSIEYVYAESSTAAITAAVREYGRRKTAETRARLAAEGRCKCGRSMSSQDRKLCDVCTERAKERRDGERAQRPQELVRKKVLSEPQNPNVSAKPFVRDEKARIAKNLERQRDRRSEIRLEVLLEVRRAFTRASTNGQFAAWLAQEVKLALTKDSAVTMSPEQLDAEICSIADAIRESQLNQRRVAR